MSHDGTSFERVHNDSTVKMHDPDAMAASMGKKPKHRPGRRASAGGLWQAEDALASGDLSRATTMADNLRARERATEEQMANGGGAGAKAAKAREAAEERKRRDFLVFQKEEAIKGIRRGDMRRRNSLPMILAELGEDKPKTRTGGGSVVAARHQAIEMTRAGNADIPWHKMTANNSKDEHGNRMSASMQAIHRRNSYNAIPMAAPAPKNRSNPAELPSENGFAMGGRMSIHS